MDMRRLLRGTVAVGLLGVLGGGCVEPFGGSFILVDFSGAVTPPAVTAGPPAGEQPWLNSHFSFYWTQNATDADGNDIVYSFKANDFEIKPLVNFGPDGLVGTLDDEACQMDIEPSDWPGIHVAGVLDRFLLDAGFATKEEIGVAGQLLLADGSPVPEDSMDDEKIRAVLMFKRYALLPALGAISVVASASTATPPATDTVCAEEAGSDPNLVPPPGCYDDASNERRLAVCNAFFDDPDHPENQSYYIGSDRVITFKVNGEFYGTVFTLDPKNPAATPLVGARFFVPADMKQVDSLLVTWQFNDVDEDGAPDYPTDFPDEQKSPIGTVYMSGTPIANPTREVINVEMANAADANINGEAVVYNDLDTDDVHF